MAQWINVLQNNGFVNPMRLPLLCEKTGALRAVHTMKIMRIKFESIRIASIHTEAALTAMRIRFTFSQSTSIGGLKPVCNHNPLIT